MKAPCAVLGRRGTSTAWLRRVEDRMASNSSIRVGSRQLSKLRNTSRSKDWCRRPPRRAIRFSGFLINRKTCFKLKKDSCAIQIEASLTPTSSQLAAAYCVSPWGHRSARCPPRRALPKRTKAARLYTEWGLLVSCFSLGPTQLVMDSKSEKTDRAGGRLLKLVHAHTALCGYFKRRFRFLVYPA